MSDALRRHDLDDLTLLFVPEALEDRRRVFGRQPSQKLSGLVGVEIADDVGEILRMDLVEQVAIANEWSFQRQNEDELAAEISGHWCQYRMWFCWHPELGVMHLSCALEMKVPAGKRAQIYALLAMANEKLWLGHFDLWSEENLPVFRHALLLREGVGVSSELLEDLVDIAVTECERFYPAFQFVIWGGKSATEALTAAMLETEGEA